MRAFLCIGFVGLVLGVATAIIGLVVPVTAVDSVSSDGWSGRPVSIVSEGVSSESMGAWAPCSGREALVSIRDKTPQYNGCVFGSTSQVRMTRYISDRGIFEYAIAHPYEEVFTEVRGLCTASIRCVYSPESDAFYMQVPIAGWHFMGVIHKNVTKQLIKQTDGSTWYEFSPTDTPIEIRTDQTFFSADAASFSKNGRWAVVELHDYGVVRVDMTTNEVRRVIAPGARYGVSRDPTYELAASNDGKHVAVVGWRLGLEVVEVNETCGDVLTDESGNNFQPNILHCEGSIIDRYELFPGFSVARKPIFSDNGKQLGVTVESWRGVTRAIISPFEGQPNESTKYVAIGDSFTSGEGETSDMFYIPGTNTAENKCHVSTRSYPFLVGNTWGTDTTNAACSGARIVGVLKEHAVQLATLARIQPEIITLGIGGNDAGLMDKLKSCIMPTVCEWAAEPSLRSSIIREIQAIAPRLTELIQKIRNMSPGAKIVAIGYPLIVNETLEAQCGLPLSIMLNHQERAFMGETIRYLNRVVQSVTVATGVSFAVAEQAFTGSLLCDNGPAAMNGVRLGDDIAPISALPTLKIIGAESFHPTPYGHNLIAKSITEQYTEVSSIIQCPDCSNTYEVAQPSAYWTNLVPENSSVNRRLISLPFTEKGSYKPADSIEVTTPALFHPDSEVIVEVRSEPVEIARIRADDTGVLKQSVVLPSNISPGYHTLHLYGISPLGDSLDAYSVVWIEGEGGEGAGEVTGGGDSLEVLPNPTVPTTPIIPTPLMTPTPATVLMPASNGITLQSINFPIEQTVKVLGETSYVVPQSSHDRLVDQSVHRSNLEKANTAREDGWFTWIFLGGGAIAVAGIFYFIYASVLRKTG